MKRQYRLRRSSDFHQVRRDGKSKASTLMVLAFLRNDLSHSRFGFVVNKRLGNAVKRNKIKRQMREATRLQIEKIKPGFDIIFIARQPIRSAEYKEIEQTLSYLLRKQGLYLT